MAISGIESKNLEAHVTICEQRYEHLCRRIDIMENELNNLEKAITRLSQKIDNYIVEQNKKFDNIYKSVIMTLVAMVGFFAANFFLSL